MKREVKQELIKENIINAMIQLLEEKPLKEMTTDEISKKADVSKRTLYKYYSSKREMYLGLVDNSFKSMNQFIQFKLDELTSNDPWEVIVTIGRAYINYSLDNPSRMKIILEYNEYDYLEEFENWVEEIRIHSNKYELLSYIKDYYEYYDFLPDVSIESISLYLWAEVQGLAMLLLAKREWLKAYYNLNEQQIIQDHMQFSKKILGGKKNE